MMISQSLEITQKQTLKLNAQLIQSLELMALPALQLKEKIETELMENPTLTVKEGSGNDVSYEEYYNAQQKKEARSDSYSDTSSSWNEESSDSHQSWFENALSTKESLSDHLLWQLGCSNVNESVAQCAAVLISNLDENGFHSQPPERVLKEDMLPYMNEALELLHGFDPSGIACTDFRQSLVVQAENAGLDGDELKIFTRLVYDELENVRSGKTDTVAKDLKLSQEEVNQLVSFLRTLTPYPGAAYSSTDDRFNIPDVSIKVEDGRLNVRLNDSAIPALTLDASYQEMERQMAASSRKEEKDTARYLKKQLQSAQTLISQIDLRNSTLEKVAKVLAVRQKGFFLFGPASLKPLTLKDVAQEIGVHEATVSRITSGKYADTDWGVIPLKSLFSSAVRTSTGEEEMSKTAVKEMVRNIILSNTTGKALSDQKISDILREKGISCARRTVNKYRKELNIDSSFERSS